MVTVSSEQQKKVRIAARALARAGFVHAYGHCSLRLDAEYFLVCTAKPMGLITPSDIGTVVPVQGELPEGVLGEVRIHQYVYRNRPDVNSVCRTMPQNVMALSALHGIAKPRHGFGSYFSPAIPMWDDVQLVRSNPQAEGVAELMADGKAVIMRGNGLVTAGADIERAVVWAWYAEDMCRVEMEALRSGSDAPILSHEECLARATENGHIIERMWDYLTFGDVEL
ncbi:class II aldolase/adducin family protein [Kordiimonas pumila]|uniref:Class II aldolase/adducin family protein n=1 Tax=Kordiimonas pumila TaxID=2161677 RepID=A0ABV7D7E4_9PROT|nr:class II aldolase/adducin family protein [Kordiimonas pumila]